MLLREFLALQEVQDAEGNFEQEITGLTYDSREVDKGNVFFAIPGEKFDGHDFIAQATRRGAAAVVVERSTARPNLHGTMWIRVKDVRHAMGLWGARFFGDPSRHMQLVGVTGTNGKTTVAYLVESILSAAGMEPGVIGTINYRYRGRELPSHHTTPESLELHALLAEMKAAGVRSAAMEVSSHALVQERVRGIDFDVALFTNLSRDHLDYHKDMDDYFTAKSRLFTDYLRTSAKPKRAAVIHAGDPRGAELLKQLHELGLESLSYGREGDWHVRPLKVESDVHGLKGTIQAKQHIFDFSSPLIGTANLENILGAVGVGLALGLPGPAIRRGIEDLKSVPGRLEKVDNNLGMTILVDYAHTPDALEKVLGAVRPLARRRVLTVFGCGGDRDRGKRPLMGEIAARLSDLICLTSDNPRSEDPVTILKDVEAGVQKTGLRKFQVSPCGIGRGEFETRDSKRETERGYCVEADRREAIRVALRQARSGDVVLIAGKGHEDYQILGSTRVHFDDRQVAREELASMASHNET
ncbi:MAG: UDP-N-acetylmuramoyl-L-alanyl-D-glutamate--2,6-diaminopimelate ligase [Candidatus Binatia bacterium]